MPVFGSQTPRSPNAVWARALSAAVGASCAVSHGAIAMAGPSLKGAPSKLWHFFGKPTYTKQPKPLKPGP